MILLLQYREDILHLQLHPRRQLTFPLCKPNILHPFYLQSGKHLLCRPSAGGKIQARLSNWCASENTSEPLGAIHQVASFSFKTADDIHLCNACYNFTWIYMICISSTMHINFRGIWMLSSRLGLRFHYCYLKTLQQDKTFCRFLPPFSRLLLWVHVRWYQATNLAYL